MNKIFFKSPTAYVIANGESKHLSEYLKKLGVRKCLLVTDAVIKQLGTAATVMESAKKGGISFVEYTEFQP